MELNQSNTTTTVSASAAAATSDAENETPPHPLSIKSKAFTNGSFAHHHHHHLHHHTSPPPVFVVIFKECLKNHAASIGGHALDGCGEFMPSPDSTVTEPASLTCAACGCHRNFHRRDHDGPSPVSAHFLEFRRGSPSPSSSPPPPPPPHVPPQMLLALRPTGPEDHPVTMNNHHHHSHHQYPHSVATPATPTAYKVENSSGRKRFRTKFSQDQKDKMLIFAEKLGWKMQRCDDNLIEKFCNEIGISRGVLKVWLHNNKSTLGKRDSKLISFDSNNNNNNNNHNIRFQNQPQINEVSVVTGVNYLNLHNISNTNAASSSDS